MEGFKVIGEDQQDLHVLSIPSRDVDINVDA